jgi:hypothetical protein
VRGSWFSMILLAFPTISRLEKWTPMLPDHPEPFGDGQAGERILEQRLRL